MAMVAEALSLVGDSRVFDIFPEGCKVSKNVTVNTCLLIFSFFKEREAAEKRYSDVIRCIVRRYVMAEQKKQEDFGITEDDVNEIRQDINKFR